jgi:hypothetical protein
MTYKEKLESPYWIAKRHWIIRLDNYHCRNCQKPAFNKVFNAKTIIRGNERFQVPGNTFIIIEDKLELNVHHKYYMEGKEPWEYDDKALITLCPDCHKKEHENNVIFVLTQRGEVLRKTSTCSRCGGSGYIPRYSRVENGICFKCGGEGIFIEELDE